MYWPQTWGSVGVSSQMCGPQLCFRCPGFGAWWCFSWCRVRNGVPLASIVFEVFCGFFFFWLVES
eukprot:NODE_1257_length_573_cov_91.064885_g1182_i0.p1 GENE.NODE_1257_length_573_cov_91.064885_g1182_i0~~NODE_1257_length_573_cov_91.064885_g1182_i0.p1  ORF type:complete len:65 (+),score=12.41 NODE_1257_length_573_cov_91.064885_g1182_i0:208-402(+)